MCGASVDSGVALGTPSIVSCADSFGAFIVGSCEKFDTVGLYRRPVGEPRYALIPVGRRRRPSCYAAFSRSLLSY
jgi:hypothetical protein